MQDKAGTASPKKAGVSIAETAAAAALREQLASLGIKEEKVAPAVLGLVEEDSAHVLVHVVPGQCCVPLPGKAEGILCANSTSGETCTVSEVEGVRRIVCGVHGKGKALQFLLEDGWFLLAPVA